MRRSREELRAADVASWTLAQVMIRAEERNSAATITLAELYELVEETTPAEVEAAVVALLRAGQIEQVRYNRGNRILRLSI